MRTISLTVVALVAGLGAASWFVVHGAKHPARPKAPTTSVAHDSEPASPALMEQAPIRVQPFPKTKPVPVSSAAASAGLGISPQEAPYRELFVVDGPAVAESWKYQDAIRTELGKLPRSVVDLESLDCRARLCKAQLLFDSADSDMKILKAVFLDGSTPDFPHGFGALAAPMREHLADGQVRTTLYLAREGEMALSTSEPEAVTDP